MKPLAYMQAKHPAAPQPKYALFPAMSAQGI